MENPEKKCIFYAGACLNKKEHFGFLSCVDCFKSPKGILSKVEHKNKKEMCKLIKQLWDRL